MQQNFPKKGVLDQLNKPQKVMLDFTYRNIYREIYKVFYGSYPSDEEVDEAVRKYEETKLTD
jgi:hypothetical protein